MDENPVVGPVNPAPEKPLENKRSLWQVFFSSKNRIMGTIAVILLAIAIPLTVIQSQQQQETRQRASTTGSTCSGTQQTPLGTIEYSCSTTSPGSGWGKSAYELGFGGCDSTQYCWVKLTSSTTAVNGECGKTTNNSCIKGTLNDIPDSGTQYLWQCKGLNGGTTDSCSLPLPGTFTCSGTQNTSVGTVEYTCSTTSPGSGWGKSAYELGFGGCDSDEYCWVRLKTTSMTTPTPTPTRMPTPTPRVTVTPPVTQPPGSMTLALNVGLDGIGAAGDHAKPCTSLSNCESNKNSKTTARELSVSVFDQSKANKTPNLKTTVTYDTATGTFKGAASANLTAGVYTIKVKSPGFLTKNLASIQNLITGTNQIPSANLTNGDIDNDNSLTVLDYNILISCSIYSNDAKASCNKNAEYKKLSDLNDDGTIDLIDYNLFLREYSVQNGD